MSEGHGSPHLGPHLGMTGLGGSRAEDGRRLVPGLIREASGAVTLDGVATVVEVMELMLSTQEPGVVGISDHGGEVVTVGPTRGEGSELYFSSFSWGNICKLQSFRNFEIGLVFLVRPQCT